MMLHDLQREAWQSAEDQAAYDAVVSWYKRHYGDNFDVYLHIEKRTKETA